MLFSWTVWFPEDIKIRDAYQMLKKQGARCPCPPPAPAPAPAPRGPGSFSRFCVSSAEHLVGQRRLRRLATGRAGPGLRWAEPSRGAWCGWAALAVPVPARATKLLSVMCRPCPCGHCRPVPGWPSWGWRRLRGSPEPRVGLAPGRWAWWGRPSSRPTLPAAPAPLRSAFPLQWGVRAALRTPGDRPPTVSVGPGASAVSAQGLAPAGKRGLTRGPSHRGCSASPSPPRHRAD